MNVVAGTRPLLHVLVAPDVAFASLRQRPAIGFPLLVIATTAAILLFLQSLCLETALRDSAAAELGPMWDTPQQNWLLWLRLAMVLATPMGMVLRATAFGSLLHALQEVAGGQCGWRQCVALAILLETVYLVESGCTLLLLAWARPQSFEALQTLHLQAGLDLFWKPSSAFLQALTTAANVFVLWWGWLLMEGTSRLAGLSRIRAAFLVLPLWLIALTLRVLLQPH